MVRLEESGQVVINLTKTSFNSTMVRLEANFFNVISHI